MSKVLAWKVAGANVRCVKEAAGALVEEDEVREATSGAIVATLPRVYAVADRAQVQQEREQQPETKPELAFYRKYTEALLRKYLRMSTETGRVPSLLGREMFRGNVTRYRVRSFEDVVIFCHDVERCLLALNPGERDLIKRIALQEYTQGEAASMLGMSLRNCIRRYGMALDHLTAVLLRQRMLEPLAACQGGRQQ